MKVKILRDTVAGGATVAAGTVVDVTEAEARLLVALGKGEPMAQKKRTATKRGGRQAVV